MATPVKHNSAIGYVFPEKSTDQKSQMFQTVPSYGVPVYVNELSASLINTSQTDSKVTEDQKEEFVQGFELALRQFHQQKQQVSMTPSAKSEMTSKDMRNFNEGMYNSSPNTILAPAARNANNGSSSIADSFTSVLGYDNVVSSTQDSPQNTYYSFAPNDFARVPTMVGDTHMGAESGGEDEEKQGKKRARNRAAARKCREKKLKRIADLEAKVNEMKSVNSRLGDEMKKLQDSVTATKHQIMQHVQCGCSISLH